MIDILRTPDAVKVISDGLDDVKVSFELNKHEMQVYITADKGMPKFICLRWNYLTREPVCVMGDKWERSYADLSWHGLCEEYFMPWYFMAANGKETVGCGVKIQPNSFVSFEYDASGVSAWLDVRCGAKGVNLNGRKLLAATIVCEHYSDMSTFEATERFCDVMAVGNNCLPKEPVYGGNNWYYAYGESSREEILEDAKFIADLTVGNENRPYMVIDDGWEINKVGGPWRANDKYGDMGTLAQEFKDMGVKPGIWIRLLHDVEAETTHPEWTFGKEDDRPFLDPSHPEVQEYLRGILREIKGWGYELLKHDFSTRDIFGTYGINLNGMITAQENWGFYDETRTSAEIVLDFYRLIREETEGMCIIGCNTVSHLCAGLVEINRIGDDTSGRNWDRTRALGVNTLAFRLPQNNRFYVIDADCVGILGDNIPWELNRQWLELLAKSGSPLFVSCEQSSATDEMKEEIRKAFKISSVQKDYAVPLDWEYNKNPCVWKINDEVVTFDWVKDTYPMLLKDRKLPH